MLDALIDALGPAAGSQESDMPAAPSLLQVRGYAKERQALGRKGEPRRHATWCERPRRTSGLSGQSLKAWDTNVRSGQTAMLGLGRKVREQHPLAQEMLLAVGFHLYTHSSKNLTDEGEPAYAWPDDEIMTGLQLLQPCVSCPGPWSAEFRAVTIMQDLWRVCRSVQQGGTVPACLVLLLASCDGNAVQGGDVLTRESVWLRDGVERAVREAN